MNDFIISGARRDFSYRPGLSRFGKSLGIQGPSLGVHESDKSNIWGEDVLHSYFGGQWEELFALFFVGGEVKRYGKNQLTTGFLCPFW